MKKVFLVMMLMALHLFAGSKDYVLVEGGSFVMGNKNGSDAEYPEHEVTVRGVLTLTKQTELPIYKNHQSIGHKRK